MVFEVTTNSDFRTLEDVLPMLGYHDYFRWFVCAREVGSEKPAVWCFVETYRQATGPFKNGDGPI